LLERVPPGYSKTLSPEILALRDRFFKAGGDVTIFTPTELKKFSAAMDDLEAKYPEVGKEKLAEFDQAKAEMAEYYKLPAGAERKAWWAAHPLLAKYYSSTSQTSTYKPSYYSSSTYKPRSYGARAPWQPPFKPPKLKKSAIPKGAAKVG
jgi:hypothetical protein